MSNYGRNFEFRIAPERGQRNGRYVNNTGAAIPLGTPVEVDEAAGTDDLYRAEIVPVTGAVAPERGKHGIVVVEHTSATGWPGYDQNLTTFSDIDEALPGQQVQVVSGVTVKVVLRNTEDRTFLHSRNYTGRVMVAGLAGATPTVAEGDYLTPGTGDDDAGYWAVGTEADGWLYVTSVDNARGELEARLTF
jgi:hypothetical protein